jgi:hypothetical protein
MTRSSRSFLLEGRGRTSAGGDKWTASSPTGSAAFFEARFGGEARRRAVGFSGVFFSNGRASIFKILNVCCFNFLINFNHLSY